MKTYPSRDRSHARRPQRLRLAVAALALAAALRPAVGAEATVAVAANFLEPCQTLETLFAARTNHSLRLSSGSTGQLYAQIVHGAPYDVLLAADRRRPRLLEAQGLAQRGSRFTYAVGALVLWSADPHAIRGSGPDVLARGHFRHLAIANPQLAPYGLAAQQTLEALGVWKRLLPKLVRGQNIAQTFQFVVSGSAELGLVARSQVVSPLNPVAGSRWDVPASLHQPIRQDAVLLAHGEDNPAASAFLRFLRSPEATRLIRSFGYTTPGNGEP
jgi:molybdate transport system substrate-binding protein